MKSLSGLFALAAVLGMSSSGMAQDSAKITKQMATKVAPQQAKLQSLEGSTYSYVTCYFSNGARPWEWGLTPNNQYYTFAGDWKTTEYTKLQKFFANADQAQLTAACAQAGSYYQNGGSLTAYFSASRSGGSNYPIVLGDTELYPGY